MYVLPAGLVTMPKVLYVTRVPEFAAREASPPTRPISIQYPSASPGPYTVVRSKIFVGVRVG